jgi:hypothetical protein
VALGVELGLALLGDAAGLDCALPDGAVVDVIGSGSSAQPTSAPTAAPAETASKRRRETMPRFLRAATGQGPAEDLHRVAG